MLSAGDIYNIRSEMHDLRNDYRETILVEPVITSGSNYEAFTDSPYDVSRDASAAETATYKTYRVKARIKIFQDLQLLGLGQVIPGLEVGDYLLYFSDRDYATVKRIYDNEHGYVLVDGTALRPNRLFDNGIGRNFDVVAHCKKFSPRFRATGL